MDDEDQVELAPWPAGDEAPSKANAAVGLWTAGLSWLEIAEHLNYSSEGRAREAVEQAVASTADEETKAKLRRKTQARFERLLRAVWPKAINGKSDEQLAAVRTAADLLSRQAKLFGLDAPAELAIYTPTTVELERYVAELTAPQRASLPSEADDILVGEVVDTDDERKSA